MILKIKLKHATYEMHIDGPSMTVDVTSMSEATDEKPSKAITSTLGYYGPAQVEHGLNRIIAHELTLDNEVVGLKEFLNRYRAIHELVVSEIAGLKEAIKEGKLAEHGEQRQPDLV